MKKFKRFVDQCRGLYYFLRYSKRLPLPLTEGGLSTFGSVMYAWRHGYPEVIYVGSFLEFYKNLDDENMIAAKDMITYMERMTDDVYGAFQCYPIEEAQIIYHPVGDLYDALQQRATLGWKKRYQWSVK